MMDSVIKPAPNAPKRKQHWLIWILLALVLCAAAAIIYFAQSGQYFKGAATLPIAQGPIFYVVDELNTYHCDIGNAAIGTTNCPFEGLASAYNHVAANPQIDPVELRLASGSYLLQDLMEFEGRTVNINGSYDSSSFTKQDFNNISIVRSAMKVKDGSGKISGITTFNGGRTNEPYIEIDNTGSENHNFTISNVSMSNSGFPSLIKYSSDSSSNQALIQDLYITNSNATGGSIIEINGPADVLLRNNFLSGNYADAKPLIYAEDNVKIVNNAIVNTPGGNETGGIYTNGAIEIKGGMDAKLINNTFADNAFNGPVVKQDSADDYMWINNNLLLGSKHIFNVPELSAVAARGNYWDIGSSGFGETAPIYGINQTYNGKCDAKLAANRNPSAPDAYKLGSGSDCIDKGVNSSAILNLASPDYFGTNRPATAEVDPGFGEYFVKIGFITTLRPLTVVGADDPAITSVLEGLQIPDITRDPFQFSVCGDGVLNTTEECDDGNTANGDGCSATCTEEVSEVEECGNGILESTEDCDDGNTANGDGCSAACTTETSTTEECGNGIVESGEQCDDGNTVNNDNCDSQCQFEDTADDDDDDDDDDEEEEEGAACGEWTDISDKDIEYDIWVWLCEKDILKGHADGTLRPDDLLTRAELLALAFRASDFENEFEVDEDASYCFVDVDDEWFAQYACSAEELGFVEGYAGNIFGPARKVILAEGLKMFLGALDEPLRINSNPDRWYFDMLFDAEDDDYLPYTLTDPQVVGPIELTRRKAANMLYRIMIYR